MIYILYCLCDLYYLYDLYDLYYLYDLYDQYDICDIYDLYDIFVRGVHRTIGHVIRSTCVMPDTKVFR